MYKRSQDNFNECGYVHSFEEIFYPEKKIAYSRKPDEMTMDEWQSELRKQFARDQKCRITNIGTHPVFTDGTKSDMKRNTDNAATGEDAYSWLT